MTHLNATPLSGMNAAQHLLQTTAHNIANLNTEGFKRRRVAQTKQANGGVASAPTSANEPGPALATDVVAQLQAKNAFLANLSVFRAQDTMLGTLLDTKR